jgi:hypothetical protein
MGVMFSQQCEYTYFQWVVHLEIVEIANLVIYILSIHNQIKTQIHFYSMLLLMTYSH